MGNLIAMPVLLGKYPVEITDSKLNLNSSTFFKEKI